MRKFILFVLAFLILALLALGVTYFVTYYNVKTFEGLIVNKDDDYDFKQEILTTYSDYQDVLDKYNGMGKLTSEDFTDRDYLVDFVPYVKDMTINDIEIEVMDKNINIIYTIDKDVSKSNKLLVNFIPVEKGKIIEFDEVTHQYN